jgi:hypothetical protein
MPKDQTKKFELGVIEVGTVVLDVSPPAATYTSAKTVYWNSSGIQWKFHSSQDPLEWSESDPRSIPLYPESTLMPMALLQTRSYSNATWTTSTQKPGVQRKKCLDSTTYSSSSSMAMNFLLATPRENGVLIS